MHPVYKLKDTQMEEAHKDWAGREVRDRYGRRLGRVKDILIEGRTLEDALKEDQDPEGWAARADFVSVSVERRRFDRLGSNRIVLLPINSLKEEGAALVANEDGDEIRLLLAS